MLTAFGASAAVKAKGHQFSASLASGVKAALLKKGTNTLKLTAPANNWVQGVLYDYLRLEVADG